MRRDPRGASRSIRADPVRRRPRTAQPVPDLKRKLPGRGVWVTATPRRPRRGDQAQGRSPAASSARSALPPDLGRPDRTAAGARRARCAGDRRQGRSVAAGFAKTEAALEHEEVAGLLHAAEAAPDGVRKLEAALQRQPARRYGARRDRIFDLGAIGFGIGPPKCGTCSPARRPCERDLFWRAAGAWNGFGPAIRARRPQRLRRT